MHIALYQPDIPQNAGTLMRLGAALGVTVEIVEPAGFVIDDRRLRRALMDYADLADIRRHADWTAFQAERRGRLVLLTTRASLAYTAFAFAPDDVLLLGRESAGVPEAVHNAADHRVTIPMAPGARSLNVAVAGAMVLGEALRQTRWQSRQGSYKVSDIKPQPQE